MAAIQITVPTKYVDDILSGHCVIRSFAWVLLVVSTNIKAYIEADFTLSILILHRLPQILSNYYPNMNEPYSLCKAVQLGISSSINELVCRILYVFSVYFICEISGHLILTTEHLNVLRL